MIIPIMGVTINPERWFPGFSVLVILCIPAFRVKEKNIPNNSLPGLYQNNFALAD